MKIAILDSGIDASELAIPITRYSFVENSHQKYDEPSHGTICAKIIETYGMVDKIFDIVCLSGSNNGTLDILSSALELCTKLDIQAINISNGSYAFSVGSKEYQRISSVCKLLSKKGVLIFAAQSNNGYITIPANFDYVFSVEQKRVLANSYHSIYRKSDIYANGKHVINIKGKSYITMKCNSFACAYVCANATKCISATKKIDFPKGIILNESSKKQSLFKINGKKRKITSKWFYPLLCNANNPIPIITIESDRECVAFQVAESLKECALQSGYLAAITSENILNSISKFKIKNDWQRNKRISYFCKASNCDMLFCVTSFHNKCEFFHIKCKSGECYIINMENKDMICTSVDEIYSQIMEAFG